GEHHQQGFATPLEMPDETLLRVALHYATDHLVGREILLVAADDFDSPVLFVRGKQGEVLEDVQYNLRPEHVLDSRPYVVKLAFLLVPLVPPWPPHIDRHADGAIAEQTALRGERESVRHEHRRDLFLVNLVELERAVEPSHRAARRGLGLTNDQR